MFRGTTPTITIEVDSELDLNLAQEIWVTFKEIPRAPVRSTAEPAPTLITKTLKDINIDDNLLLIPLSQLETLKFKGGRVEVQVRILMDDNTAYASDIEEVEVNRILSQGVIS